MQFDHRNENFHYFRTYFVFACFHELIAVISNEEFGLEVKNIYLFDFTKVCKGIEQLANIFGTGYCLLEDFAKGFEYWVVVDAGEVEIDSVFFNTFLEQFFIVS